MANKLIRPHRSPVLKRPAVAAGAVALWKSNADYNLKAAGLVGGALLATPYVFAHDLPILAVAFAFLYRQRAFDGIEYLALGAAMLFFLVFAFLAVPVASFASVVLVMTIARRLHAAS